MLAYIAVTPSAPLHEIERECGVPRDETARKILKQYEFKPYKYRHQSPSVQRRQCLTFEILSLAQKQSIAG
ncbi:hypothetical protein ILUMI_20048 [Ignelater luminosus]|uniref:Uncharacterized protein n=1 Tax=Ignelater luminosus TaxID=2038154 RepID=A0A8K0FZA6_IGNLU|nr:hypothetical protein ILUMI_20048 [Ignelater luminosus]